MVFSNSDKPMMWCIRINPEDNLSNNDRDFIVELVSEEARKIPKPYYFILHDVVESERYSIMLIEGTKIALRNLLPVIRDNFPCKIIYRRCKV